MTLLLSESDVEAALDLREAIDGLDLSFRSLAEGEAVNRPRSHSYTALGEGRHHLFKTMDGGVRSLGVHALRVSSDVVVEAEGRSGTKRVKLAAAPGNRYVGLVLLFDIHRLIPIAIMPDGYLQRMRVGATSALAARYLARSESATVGLIGTGWQAGAQILALAADRSLDEIRVFGPTPEHVDDFVSWCRDRMEVPIVATESARAAIDGSDIVALATNALDPVLDGSWLEAGQHVGSVQGYELDMATYDRADVIAVRSLEPSTYHYAPGQAPREAERGTRTRRAHPGEDDRARFDRGGYRWPERR